MGSFAIHSRVNFPTLIVDSKAAAMCIHLHMTGVLNKSLSQIISMLMVNNSALEDLPSIVFALKGSNLCFYMVLKCI